MLGTQPYELIRAKLEGKKTFKVYDKTRIRYVLGSSLKQVRGKFRKWNVEEISFDEYIKIIYGT